MDAVQSSSLPAASESLRRLFRGETHDRVHGSFINLMKLPNEGKLIFLQTISCFDVVLVMKECLV